ncbi:S49 family peptidase [Vibrio parahaemolyticus]|nr:S49 family peptidase [Vibrio parahaemolyticus]MDF4668713.1 S49 family peptidase [Vibrio parahaemolyticus]HAV1412738.1 S49 family peptidase [Vibrio parahaemolyticus]HAV2004820.1 S49 family peptidase [Vibrio parahaemolyticus]
MMNDCLWLIEGTYLNTIMGRFSSLLKSGELYSRDTWFDESHDRFRGDDEIEIIGTSAYIYVTGALVGHVGWWEWLDNYTRYPAIEALTRQAEAHRDVEDIVYVFDTPGGLTNGVERAGITIANASKPTKALVKNGAYSAGYWLASQCDEIVADVTTSAVGSVGTVIEFWDPSGFYEELGFKHYSFVSEGSEKKRPDPATEEGKAEFQKIVDTANKAFLNAVAKGRGVDIDYIKKNFGQGGIVYAEDAVQVGMIDSINVNSDHEMADGGQSGSDNIEGKEESRMDRKELESKHPDLVLEIKQEAVKEEQDRVGAWAEFIDVDPSAVKKGIESGAAMTQKDMVSLLRKETKQKLVTEEVEASEEDVDTPDVPDPSSTKSEEQEADDLLASFGLEKVE